MALPHALIRMEVRFAVVISRPPRSTGDLKVAPEPRTLHGLDPALFATDPDTKPGSLASSELRAATSSVAPLLCEIFSTVLKNRNPYQRKIQPC